MKKWILATALAVVAVILYSVYIYKDTMNGKLEGEAKAISIATQQADLSKVTAVDYYHGVSSYKIVQGTDKKGAHWIVWVPDKKGKVLIRKLRDGISQQEAIQIVMKERNPKEIVKVKLGAESDIPLWEITYIDQENRYTYYYLNFIDGKYEGYYSI
jgi:uncharacterized protein YpmB